MNMMHHSVLFGGFSIVVFCFWQYSLCCNGMGSPFFPQCYVFVLSSLHSSLYNNNNVYDVYSTITNWCSLLSSLSLSFYSNIQTPNKCCSAQQLFPLTKKKLKKKRKSRLFFPKSQLGYWNPEIHSFIYMLIIWHLIYCTPQISSHPLVPLYSNPPSLTTSSYSSPPKPRVSSSHLAVFLLHGSFNSSQKKEKGKTSETRENITRRKTIILFL